MDDLAMGRWWTAEYLPHLGNIALEQQVADTGGGDRLLPGGHERFGDDLHADLAAVILQKADIATGLVSKTEIIADDHQGRAQVRRKKHLTKNGRGYVRKLVGKWNDQQFVNAEIADEVTLDIERCQDGRTLVRSDDRKRVRVESHDHCLLYTSDAADDLTRVDLGGRRII